MAEERREPCPRWIRGYHGGSLVVDSRSAQYAWLDRPYPVLVFPESDVQLDRVTVQRRLDGGLVLVDRDALDVWLEEDDVVLGHTRDPYHRVDVRRSSREVEVRWGDEPVARSHRPTIAFETGLPPRLYLPRPDVSVPLERTEHTTICPYKGIASYFSLVRPGETLQNVVWSYEQPFPGVALLAGLVSFLPDRVEVWLDGERAR